MLLCADPTIEDINGLNALTFWWTVYRPSDPSELAVHICERLLYYQGNVNSAVGLFHFFMACISPYLAAVEYFLERGTDPNSGLYTCRDCAWNCGSITDCTALHFVLCNDFPVEHSNSMIKLLLKYGADINKTDIYMSTTLHIAAVSGTALDVMKFLLKEGADRDINVQNIYGNTPLHVACGAEGIAFKNFGVLLESGADINIENDEGETPMMGIFEVTNARREYVVPFMKQVKKLEILGFHVNDKNKESYRKRLRLLKDLDADDDGFGEDKFVDKCETELGHMSTVKMNTNTTLRDVIFRDAHDMALLVENIPFRRILELESFDDMFPVYGYLLKIQFKKGLERKPFLEPGKASMRLLSKIQLPNDCAEYIIQYMTNTDLETIIRAVGVYSR